MINQNILDGDFPSFENNSVKAVSSNNLETNVLVGSYVIIPKSSVETPFELTDEEWADTKEMMNTVKEYIDKTFKPDGYNLGWNVGKVGGQNVAHAHLHILPRYSDEPLAGKGIRYWLKKDNVRTSLLENKKD